MMEAWHPLLFADEGQQAKQHRDPVAAAERSDEAERKASSKRLTDGSPAHGFQSLLRHLSTLVRNTCRRHGPEPGEPSFVLDTQPSPLQSKALGLLTVMQV